MKKFNVFGWSYPPGCSGPPDQSDGPCAVCGELPDDCICPECTQCGAIGDPNCYKPGFHVQTMERTAEQNYSLMWNEAHWENANFDENKYYRDNMTRDWK